ncbi:DNA repair protein RecO [Halalkalibacterium halodurans]|uniref:DNA repair protein RecO n=1 Tax=Halalkalibacterium halodurans TaxID=86665 RepID=A0A0M0KMG7_ALKHA|nr:DNA repair protein RecO [Halalkalibacterium halodurans]MED4122544.1 DNA repair protein RecO [Halalkalibacterium halodurans]MED4162517.1 DNA repair protein RecO [Halalkalibacterium halodurans]TPE69106.1 DNA repair protein RecO [Halalkalibacterium halodurans]
MFHKAEGIVIRTVDYGESNKIVTVFTREYGKIALMARGAKRPKSRLTAVTQLFTYGMMMFQKNAGLGTLTQGEIIQSFREVRNDLFRASYVSYVTDLTNKLTEDEKRNPYLFELLYQTIHYMNEGMDPDVLTRIFEVKMFTVAGIKPELDQCVSCGSTDVPVGFSIKEAGFLCKRCIEKDPHAYKITAQVAKLLRLFYHFDLQRLGTISLKPETKATLKTIIHQYYDEYSGLHLKSRRFLDQLESMGFHDQSTD